ncbi:DNA alkylation repair protein [soil metagenome]
MATARSADAKELILAFEQHANAARAIAMSDYMRNKFSFYGLMKAERTVMWKPFMKEWASLPYSKAEKIIRELWKNPHRECQYFAMEYALKLRKQWTQDTLSLFEEMVQQKSWWDTVDTIASNLIGRYLQEYPEMIPKAIKRWNASDDMWLHRVSLIFQLKYGKSTDEQLLFSQCKRFSKEEDFFIRKAIGWSLRQYSKSNPQAVKTFISLTPLSPLSIKEGSKYI